MKRGGGLKRKSKLRVKSPLRRYTELRSTPRSRSGTSGEGSAVSAIPDRLPDALRGCAKRRPRAAHRLPVDVRQVVVERSGGWCEVQLPGCSGRADQVHHRVTQKAGGRHGSAAKRSDRPSNCLHLDAFCHDLITDKPGRAYTYGWSLRERQEPTQEPVLYRGGLVYLDDLGGAHSFEEVGA